MQMTMFKLLANGDPNGPMDPLSCEVALAAGGGLSWGSGYSCTNYNFYVTPGGNISLPNATVSYAGCVTLTVVNDMEGITGVMINEWTEQSRSAVLSVPFPNARDPKLVAVPRTVLDSGLYEYVIIMNDGRLMNFFFEVEESLTLTADFADFININIYPVPVEDRYFAIDLDIPAPTTVEVTIVNNTGLEYYGTELTFERIGRNKHVVRMDQQWPNGIYHALFHFADGSYQTRTFSVQIP